MGLTSKNSKKKKIDMKPKRTESLTSNSTSDTGVIKTSPSQHIKLGITNWVTNLMGRERGRERQGKLAL